MFVTLTLERLRLISRAQACLDYRARTYFKIKLSQYIRFIKIALICSKLKTLTKEIFFFFTPKSIVAFVLCVRAL